MTSKSLVNSRHPALAMKALEDKSQMESAEIRQMEEWDTLTIEDKHFLSLYIMTRDARKAAERASLSLSWMEERERESEGFAKIVQVVLEHPKRLADALILEMVPYSVLKLEGLISQDSHKNAQLGAIKHLHALAQMVHGDATFANQLVNIKVTPWETGSRVIEVE